MRNGVGTALAVMLISLAAPGASAGPETTEEATMDATVETSWGSRVRLAALFGKPTVLFYEDRDAGPTNQHVKDALFARGKSKGLLEAASVIAVGNVAAYDWFPARDFVLAAVRDVERQVKVPVYLDFKGALSAPPWRLPSTGSTVLVLSPGGRIVWRASGKLSPAEVAQLFAALEGQLGAGASTAP
jgi:hypothetical protein